MPDGDSKTCNFQVTCDFLKNFLTFLPLLAYTINRCSACGVGKRAGNGHSPGQFLRCIFFFSCENLNVVPSGNTIRCA